MDRRTDRGRGLNRGQVGERSIVNRKTEQKAREMHGQEDRRTGRGKV